MTWLNQYAHTHQIHGCAGAGDEIGNAPAGTGRMTIVGNRRIVGGDIGRMTIVGRPGFLVGAPPHGHGGHGHGHGHGHGGHHGHGHHGHHGHRHHGGPRHVYSPGGPYPAYYGYYDPYYDDYYDPLVYVLDPTAFLPGELGTKTRTRMGT